MHMGFGLRGRAEGGGFGGYVGTASSGRELPGPALASATAASKASVAASCSNSSTPPMCVSPKKICGTVALSASLSMPCVRVTSATRSPRQQSTRLPPTWPPRLATVRAGCVVLPANRKHRYFIPPSLFSKGKVQLHLFHAACFQPAIAQFRITAQVNLNKLCICKSATVERDNMKGKMREEKRKKKRPRFL